MAQEEVDRAHIDARFAPMGGKAVAQRMETLAVRDPGGPLGVGGDLLGRRDGHGRGRGLSGTQPRGRAGPLPGGPPCAEEARREEGRAILMALALIDAEHHPIPLEVRALEADDLTDPQPCGRGRHE